jgi:hypothetical protein
VPTTMIGCVVAATGGCRVCRGACQNVHPNSCHDPHTPNSGNCLAKRDPAALISASVGPGALSLRPRTSERRRPVAH